MLHSFACIALKSHILHLRAFVSHSKTLPARFKASKPIYRLMFIILTSLWEVAVCLVTFTDLVVLGAHTIDPLLTSCSNCSKSSHLEAACVWVFTTLALSRGDFLGRLYRKSEVWIREEKLLNCAQRSTQPWVLLFSLETLICNRSPLPLSPLQAYVITSSCGL